MSPSNDSSNSSDPLVNLQKLIEFLAAVIYQLFTKSVLIFGIGSLIIILILYLFFKLLGFG